MSSMSKIIIDMDVMIILLESNDVFAQLTLDHILSYGAGLQFANFACHVHS